MKKQCKDTIQELTKREILRVDNNNKVSKYEREILKYKKEISNYRMKDRLSSKALSLCEKKINTIKESSKNELLLLCDKIKNIEESFYKINDKIDNQDIKNEFDLIGKEYQNIINEINVAINNINENAVFTVVDKEIISDKFNMSDLTEFDQFDQILELKNELRNNIAKKNKTATTKSKTTESNNKQMQNLKDEVDDNENLNFDEYKIFDENKEVSQKINKYFYEMPNSSKVSSELSSELFDFNEALNPTMSLSDIMRDLTSNSFDDDNEPNEDEDLENESEEELEEDDDLENESEEELEEDDDLENESDEQLEEDDDLENESDEQLEEDEEILNDNYLIKNDSVTENNIEKNEDAENKKIENKTKNSSKENPERRFINLRDILKDLT